MLISLFMGERDPLKSFGIVLPAVAEMMDEQMLSKEDTLAALRRFLSNGEQPVPVREAIERLEAAEDEGELRTMLGQECVRALGLRGRRP
jgi:hypothetical protein